MGQTTRSTTGSVTGSVTGADLLPDPWTALRALVARTGSGLLIDGEGSAPTDRPAVVVVTKVLPAPVASRLRATLAERSTAGARTLLAVAPAAAGAVRELGTGVVPDESPLRVPSVANPIVADPRVRLTGLPGAMVGRTFAAADVVALLGDGTPLAAAAAHPVVVSTDSLTVVGSARMLSDEWIAADDNAWLAVWTLTGRSDHEGPAEVRAHRPTTQARHAAPPVIRVADGTWDLGLLGDLTPADAGFVRAAGHAARLLPASVHDALVDFADESHPAGALLLKGVPVGNVPATPDRPTAATTKDHVSEFVLLTVARRLGQPVGYAPEHGGDVVQNILPTRTNVTRQTSTSSAVTLMFHTEAAFHPHRPRFLLLLALRGDPEARTTLASITDVVAELPLWARRTLSEPRFRLAVDESYLGRRPHLHGELLTVLSGVWDRPQLVFDADLMAGEDDEANAALQELGELVRRHEIGVTLEAGDLLVVDNSVAVHGRTPFTARFDGTDRWLQRSFVVADLAASAADRVGRVVTTQFAG